MQENLTPYQSGAMLHDAIMGAFRASGRTLERWCKDNEVSPSVACNATYGQMRGPKAVDMLGGIRAPKTASGKQSEIHPI
mgnify:CR=1 FL=1